jgi:hypothetical protein
MKRMIQSSISTNDALGHAGAGKERIEQMLGKKLLTLACAAGILGSGACFLPPLPQHVPPPPPIRLDLQGIQKIRVEVTNKSESQYLLPDALANFIANRLIARASTAHVEASPQEEAIDEDAVLAVTVLDEAATPIAPLSHGEGNAWDIRVRVAAVLTRKDGKVVWQESDGVYQFNRPSQPETPDQLWKDFALRNGLTIALGDRLAYRLLSGH